jgi:ABC-type antimicrobial peptide transport system permease subunit
VALVSLPVFNRMLDPAISINQTTWERVIIKLKDPTNKDHIMKIIKDAKSKFNAEQANGIRIYNYYDDTETTDQVT